MSSRHFCFVALAVTTLACSRLGFRRDNDAPVAKSIAAPVALEPAKLTKPAPGSKRCRLLLDEPTLARLREAAQKQTPAFVMAKARADAVLEKNVESGYQGFEWADAVAGTALLWHATGDERYATGALRYYRALLDDRLAVGDGKGGAEVVRHDSGYGIRTFGAYTALGYDWLRGAPGMDDGLRQRARQRLGEWLDWYGREGYLRDQPTANYYWGYLTALSFAGLAASGDDANAERWLKTAQSELSTRVLPTFRDDLRGGGWPEGWQYGEYTSAEIALVAHAFRTGAGVDVTSKLPWLGRTVTHHVHALLPDEKSVYDGGTWGEHPARPSGLGLAAIAVALEGVDDARAAEARWLRAHALPPLQREQAWLGLLAERPGAPERSPREGAPTSLHLAGQGLSFARSDWTKDAVWTSFQAGPRLAEDHQDSDQGHFELVRGGDQLLVDGGGSEGSATINHNTLLIDDGGKVMNYPPNQGVWGAKVKTTRFGDDGTVLVAVGDIGEAYAPKCASTGCSKRSVEKLTRSFVFVRPALLVIDDRVTLADEDYAASWAAHVTQAPKLDGDQATLVVGASRLELKTLEPAHVKLTAPQEPTPSGEGSHRLNQPWGPMWRIEAASPRGEAERHFLHVMHALPASAPPAQVESLNGEGLRGGGARAEGRSVAVLFAGAKPEAQVALAGPRDIVVIAGLEPGKHYSVTIEPGCRLKLKPSHNPSDPGATPGGFVRVAAKECG
jgi:hypothetical protein